MRDPIRVLKISLIILLILSGFGLRLYSLSADPPHWMYVFNTDEGHYSYNTHNKLKYGQWFVNKSRYALITPLFSFLQYLVATTIDTQESIIRYRAVNVLCGILSCFLMALMFREKWMRTAVLVISAWSFMGVTHSRIGIPEMMLTVFFQVTILLAWQGHKRDSILLIFFSGLTAIAAIGVKTTGVLIVPAVIIAPLLHLSEKNRLWKYGAGLFTGLTCGLIIWATLVIVPNWSSWNYMQEMATQYGRSSISFSPVLLLKSIGGFILSPALQTIPALWPMALCWCFLLYIPKIRKQSADFLDTLVFLWIFCCFAGLGLPSYQPARWQLLIFPPTIYAGLQFIRLNKNDKITFFSFLLAVSISIMASTLVSKVFLATSGPISPHRGIFSHSVLAFIAFIAVFATYFPAKKFHKEKWKAVALAVIVLNLVVQIQLFAAYTVPFYSHKNQWHKISAYLEGLSQKENAIFSGDLVENIALHADIQVIPTFYLLEGKNDVSLKKLFKDVKELPTHFIISEGHIKRFQVEAPNFMKSLKVINRFPLVIGGYGRRRIFIFQFTSYNWLNQSDRLE